MMYLKSLIIKYRKNYIPLINLIKKIKTYLSVVKLKSKYPNIIIANNIKDTKSNGKRYSAVGQDTFIIDHLIPSDFTGSFIDIGCNHPIINNNSFALEQAGWFGFAFDPQTKFKKDWETKRKTPLFVAAIGAEIGEMPFVEFETIDGWEHELSGFLSAADPAHLSARPHQIINVPTGPVSHFLPDLTSLDLALIDVEGAELLVLDGLGALCPRWLVIENNRIAGGDDLIRERLIANGYQYFARIQNLDDVFVRKDAL